MALTIYNSLTRQKELFTPIHPGRVTMYVCGPTVYNDSHLGHGKTYVNFDTMVRYMRYLGYQVLYVQNITDVGHMLDTGEDRMLKGSQREHMQPMQLAELYTRHYLRDMDRLNVSRPDIQPHASGHIPEMITWIQKLLDAGIAYEVNGSVYFSVPQYKPYGKLAGRRISEAQSGTRIDVLEEKRDPADFALWKKASPEHILRWPSPWGEGFPGWHIECTVMSIKYLGQPFDIHGGGVENKFPHHECEIAQAEAATGIPFANYWIHNGMLMIRGEEMHKSLGNYVTLAQAFEHWDPMVIRFFILLSHYRGPIDFTEEAIEAATKGLQRLTNLWQELNRRASNAAEGELSSQVKGLVDHTSRSVNESMDDDFNTPEAIAALFDMTREMNGILAGESLSRASLVYARDFLVRFVGDVLGITPPQETKQGDSDNTAGLVELLIESRNKLRQAKQWALADNIRDGLLALGIELRDGSDGTSWKCLH
ncbi:MAG: cysteine--tRNA ligase [Chloroflexi bacterium]|nr:cysteine--tRNA ligase [Chloroflexota bacterium]